MTEETAHLVAEDTLAYIRAESASAGTSDPVKPSHRVPFHWPPHPVSKDFHVLPSDWTGKAQLVIDGEEFSVDIARTAQGVFGRIEKVWNEARGGDVDEVLQALEEGSRPFFERQRTIGKTLGMPGRFSAAVRDLRASDLVRLLYCPDRDVAHEARLTIETQASRGIFAEALIVVLLDQSHPNRRSAQWCVLDMFEDLPSVCRDQDSQLRAVSAIKELICSADDDYARTVYKAGVVLGGHVCTPPAAEALLESCTAAKKFGRRSAIHGAFHLAEWMPDFKGRIIAKLEECALNDPEPALREFAASMARDIREGAYDHMTEPAFPDER